MYIVGGVFTVLKGAGVGEHDGGRKAEPCTG